MLFALFFQQQTALACTDSNCPGVTIYNCTPGNYKVRFELCCNGTQMTSDIVPVPASLCRGPAATPDFSPCTVLSLSSIYPTPAQGVTVIYNPTYCVLLIY